MKDNIAEVLSIEGRDGPCYPPRQTVFFLSRQSRALGRAWRSHWNPESSADSQALRRRNGYLDLI
jgi:hypothetical protein